jgi:hypothetical protein
MTENKTIQNDASVQTFLQAVEDEKKRDDAFKILALMEEVTGQPAKMWGASIVGFGSHHYKYESGREGDWMSVGFSPRKANITLYFSSDMESRAELLSKLGKHKTGKGCVYINKLSDVNTDVLKQLIKETVDKKA